MAQKSRKKKSVAPIAFEPPVIAEADKFKQSEQIGCLAFLRDIRELAERYGYLRNRSGVLRVAADLIPIIEMDLPRLLVRGPFAWTAYENLRNYSAPIL